MPLFLTEKQRLRLQSRLLIQPPGPGQSLPDIGRIRAMPNDVLLALEALRNLAEQGNIVAQDLYMSERKKLGIDQPLRMFMSRDDQS